jgi:hypothetical protein
MYSPGFWAEFYEKHPNVFLFIAIIFIILMLWGIYYYIKTSGR